METRSSGVEGDIQIGSQKRGVKKRGSSKKPRGGRGSDSEKNQVGFEREKFKGREKRVWEGERDIITSQSGKGH